MDIKFFIGDVDEFYCDAVEGDRRWAVWTQQSVPLPVDDPYRQKGCVSRAETTLVGRFDTEQQAQQFVENYDVGPGNNKIIVP